MAVPGTPVKVLCFPEPTRHERFIYCPGPVADRPDWEEAYLSFSGRESPELVFHFPEVRAVDQEKAYRIFRHDLTETCWVQCLSECCAALTTQEKRSHTSCNHFLIRLQVVGLRHPITRITQFTSTASPEPEFVRYDSGSLVKKLHCTFHKTESEEKKSETCTQDALEEDTELPDLEEVVDVEGEIRDAEIVDI